MKPLIVLLAVFVLSLLIRRFKPDRVTLSYAGRLAMSSMMVFSAVGHFVFSEGMAMMMPISIPYRLEIVYLSGVLEIAFAIGLLFKRFKLLTSWVLIAFFILVLPINVHAAINNVDLQTASNTGFGVGYLWFRVPLQVLFIAWVYFFGIKLTKRVPS